MHFVVTLFYALPPVLLRFLALRRPIRGVFFFSHLVSLVDSLYGGCLRRLVREYGASVFGGRTRRNCSCGVSLALDLFSCVRVSSAAFVSVRVSSFHSPLFSCLSLSSPLFVPLLVSLRLSSSVFVCLRLTSFVLICLRLSPSTPTVGKCDSTSHILPFSNAREPHSLSEV